MKLPTSLTPRTIVAGSAAVAAASLLVLSACGGGSAGNSDTVTVQGDVPIAYVMRVNTIGMNPTNGAPSAPGGDLMIREKSSPSAPEHNITSVFTQGQGDASDPEVSYDGKKIIFSMKCPTSNTGTIDGQPACTGHWNIWEYDMTTGGFTGGKFRRLTASTTDDDVDPVYLPAGQGFVFSSNRQAKSKNNQALGHTYFALDEYERERVFNLHTMAADGSNIQQITFNQSHDRNPVIRPNGDIMFSHWDHVGGRNHFKIFTVKPDGTDLFVLYGAHSEGNSFLHPRDLDPNGQFHGMIASDLMPLQRTHEGGALVAIDVQHYSEQNTPATKDVPAQGGQIQATLNELNIDRGLSMYGRITTPYPLWDGTDRVLIAYRPCEVTKDGKVVPCSTLTADEIARVSDMNRPIADTEADTVKDDVPPPYAIYMFNALNQSFLNVASPPPGFMYTDPIALLPRQEPASTSPTSIDADLAAKGLGTLDVRSVYDTDGLGRMGDPMLTGADLAAGCTTAIAKTAPTDPNDLRPQVADIAKMKDPADPAYQCAPARFIRAVRAVAPPANMMGLRSAIGETDFEPQQVLGYAPIEPDGSFKLNVPADTPIGLAVVDAQGRALQTHTNWIQVRPGERRTCDGCHSPRRGGALNSGAVVNSVPATLLASMQAAHLSGETMADTRTRLDPTALTLKPDMVYTDVWADAAKPGVTRLPDVTIKYAGNANARDNLQTPAPVNGIINYPDHIQPLWSRDRGANTCTSCHNGADKKLDLSGTIGGDGRAASYDRLMIGDPQLDANGQPVITFDDGVPMVQRLPALVNTMASEGEAVGLARKSRLIEILTGQALKAGPDALAVHPNPPAGVPDHGAMLNAAEKRLLAEWVDLGGKYYNDPFTATGLVRQIDTLDEPTFASTIYPILDKSCSGCHEAHGSTNTSTTATSFRDNRYVLTGDPDGDFGATLAMVSNVCQPTTSYLLARPSTIPHPLSAVTQTQALLPATGADYATIANWITGLCATP
jgi:hypothetical protein